MTTEIYRPATTSDAHVEPCISDLTEGEAGYTLPWALIHCDDGSVLIRGDYPIARQPQGTYSLPVVRDGGRLVVVSDLPSHSGQLSTKQQAAHAIANWSAEPVYVRREAL